MGKALEGGQLGGVMKDFKEQLCAFYVYRLPYLQCLLCFCLCLFVWCENYEKWPITLSGLEDENSQNWRNSTGNLENIRNPGIHRNLGYSIGLSTNDGMGVSRQSYLYFRLTSGLH